MEFGQLHLSETGVTGKSPSLELTLKRKHKPKALLTTVLGNITGFLLLAPLELIYSVAYGWEQRSTFV